MTRSPFSLKNNAYKLCTPNKKPQPSKYFLKHKFYSLLEDYDRLEIRQELSCHFGTYTVSKPLPSAHDTDMNKL